MKLIAADVGGTKTLLQLFVLEGEKRKVLRERRLESGAYRSFDSLLRDFIGSDDGEIGAACFAIAGPADDGRAFMTNLGWEIHASAIEEQFRIRRVRLINDFHAVAEGVRYLPPSDLISINSRPRVENAPVAILGAGTGLGEAVVVRGEGSWYVISSEGGHSSFAPRTALEREILEFLEEKFGHVSYERLLSGPGIVNIFTFFCERVYQVTPAEVGVDESKGHVAAQISDLAREGSEVARRTFDTFIDIYGAEAGNLALKCLPRGGIFIAGGIAAKNIDWFTNGRFLEAYSAKGRMRNLLLEFPVDCVSNQNLGLIGACAVAAEMASEPAQ